VALDSIADFEIGENVVRESAEAGVRVVVHSPEDVGSVSIRDTDIVSCYWYHLSY